jgi:ferric-dicitrate binding protein FerR (iron transport regulator)
MNNRDPKLIREIITRFHAKRFSGKTARDFQRWLILPENYSAKDEAMNEVWDSLVSTITGSTYKSLKKVKIRLGMTSSKKSATPLRRTMLRVAAVLLPAALVVGGYFTMQRVNDNVEWARVEVPNGQTQTYTLADGSTVCLNAGSVLEYPVEFRGRERQVKLRGEGFFKVTPDKSKPFVVTSPRLHTTVVGTEFNISAYDNQLHESVTVLSGQVDVATPEGAIHQLTPNTHLTHWIESGSTDVEEIEASSIVGWMNDELVFENSTLEDILCGIRRKYGDLKVVVDSTCLTNTAYRMKFTHGESLEYVLDVVHKVTGVRYTLNGDTLTIGE